MIIREAKKDEIDKIQLLNQEVFIANQKYDDDLIMDWAIGEQGKIYFTDLLNNHEACCFIAEEHDKLIGYIVAAPKSISYRKSKYLEIENMGVIPDFRSKGIGTQLIQKCLDWAKKQGYQKAYVNAYFDNNNAITFYKRNGFLEIDVSLERSI